MDNYAISTKALLKRPTRITFSKRVFYSQTAIVNSSLPNIL